MPDNSKMFYDFNYPLPLVQRVLGLLGRSEDPGQSKVGPQASREWMSQLRSGTSKETECITVAFRLPLSVSEISTEILRLPCLTEIWYQDRSNNWRPVLDTQRQPLSARVDRSNTRSWFRWSTHCYPIVAKKIQLRLTRYDDGVLTNTPYPVGIRNTLIRRNVYDRAQGNAHFEDDTDVMGNVVSRYVKDWDASKAADDNYGTFWRSEPQPDPSAVVSLFLDVRSDAGEARTIDKLYIDPVYTGQHLNLYFSNDDTVGVRFLSPIAQKPVDLVALETGTVTASTSTTITDTTKSWTADQWEGRVVRAGNKTVSITGNTPTSLSVGDEVSLQPGAVYSIGYPPVLNTDWEYGRGLTDIASGTEQSRYGWPMKVGPQVQKNTWIGVEWCPDFASADSNLANNPVLFRVSGKVDVPARPHLSFDPELGTFSLSFYDNQNDQVAGPYSTSPLTRQWSPRDSIRIVAGWSYSDAGDRVVVRAVNAHNQEVADPFDDIVTDLPGSVSLDGDAGTDNFRGTLLNLIIKTENPALSSALFLANPGIYCDPEPSLPDEQGRYPSTSLDNSLYVASWMSREHGCGGPDRSHYDDKEWTPIWRDYTSVKGMLYLPQPISMKYLKMEFTNLSEQPYPIYESGIEVKYKTFPASVTQTSSIGPRLYTGEGGFLGLGTFISVNGVRSVNFTDPNSIMQAIGSIAGRQIPPVTISNQTPFISETLPGATQADMRSSQRIEAASSYIYPRENLQPYILATDRYNTLIKAEGLQAIQPYVDIPWKEIEEANPDAVTKVRSTGTIPLRGSDWWIYPGQQLKVPASVMNRITATSTVTERKFTYETRVRFNTTQVHRYQWNTAQRDAAVAYFAGVREVQPYVSTLVADDDTEVYSFPNYTKDHWAFSNVKSYQRQARQTDGTARTVDNGTVTAALPSVHGILTSQELLSRSSFSKVSLSFQDSRMVRSNPMWVDPYQDNSNIDDTQLSGMFSIWPESIPKGTWSDPLATWQDTTTVWGSENGMVSVFVEPERVYDGRRMIRLTRAAGSGAAGVRLRQWKNLVPGAKFRVGATIFRPRPTGNTIVLMLRRSDGTLLVREPLGAYRVISNENVSLSSPGSTIGGSTLNSPTLVYLNGQDDEEQNGLYRFVSANVPLNPVVVGSDIGETVTESSLSDFKKVNYITSGRWTDVVSSFAEVPQSVPNHSFDTGNLNGWTAQGGTWSAVTNKGYTGTRSARLQTNSEDSSLSSDKLESIPGSTISASAWVTWSEVTTGGTLKLRANFYDENDDLVGGEDLDGQVPLDTATQTGWKPLSGSVVIPEGLGVERVSFSLLVPSGAGSGGSVWVDDFSVNVPGAPLQQFIVELMVEGTEKEEIYISDLFTEVALVRYYVRLGDDQPIEVTDLRHTNSQAIVTSTQPVSKMQVQVAIVSDQAAAYGCRITPHYLK